MSKQFLPTPLPPRPNVKTVRAPKTAEIAAKQIRNAIIRGELKDGSTLPAEMILIAEFGISRPTVREAVRILESEGLVTVARGARGGARINTPNYEMVARAAGIALQANGATIGDLYEMRTLIEPPAARLVAERNSENGARELRRYLDMEIAASEDRFVASHAIAQFHRAMLELSGNKTLTMIAQALQGLVEQHLLFSQRRQPNVAKSVTAKKLRLGFKSHAKLVDLIAAGDGEGAETHWRRHMIGAGKTWLNNVGPTSLVDLID